MSVSVFMLLCLSFGAEGPARSSDKIEVLERADFRQVVQAANAQVFPTVVFVKCLQESFSTGKRITGEVSGSGVIISSDGDVLTNHHVVDKATEIRCLTYDGQAYAATLVGLDKNTDLALLRLQLEPGKAVPYALLGDSTLLKEGDFVMAMGAPWGLSRSVSIGIVSCTKRFLADSSEYSLWLQTDASICPGNSGGPLVNTEGQVVGLNTLGTLRGGDLGFAVPSQTIQFILPQLRRSGKADWSWLGLQLQPLRDFNRNVYFDAVEGVIVSETDPESPARRAGIKARDRLIRVAEQPITALTEEDLPAVRRFLGSLEKGRSVTVELMRDTTPITVELTPTEKGRVEGEELDCPRWDMTVKTINQFENPSLYFHRKEGVYIYGIKYPGNASNSNLRENDIIVRIDGRDVTTLEDVRTIHAEMTASLGQRSRCVFTVLRGGLLNQVVLDYGRDYEKQ
jgi:serine protease Do